MSLRFQRDYQQADIIENWLKNHDGLIGATAIYHHCPVATRNVSDFEGMAVELINPFE